MRECAGGKGDERVDVGWTRPACLSQGWLHRDESRQLLKSRSSYIESGILVRTEVGRELIKEVVPERYIQGFKWECLY